MMMNIITWNCRGVGRKSFPGLVKDLRMKYDDCLFILLETHVSGNRGQAIINRVGFSGLIISDAQGHSGGIWCLWDEDFWSVTTVHISRKLVHLKVRRKDEEPWDLSAVYGSPH